MYLKNKINCILGSCLFTLLMSCSHQNNHWLYKPSTLDTLAFLNRIDTQMVLVEKGEFEMGYDTILEDCKPIHPVSVSSFYISKYIITIDIFRQFISSTGYITSADSIGGAYIVDSGDNFVFKEGVNWRYTERGELRDSSQKNMPVLYVNWKDSKAFCHWLSGISKKKYRLPTEAEWEFAYMGGILSKGFIFSGSNSLDSIAWYGLNSNLRVHEVGLKKPNELGIYDMTGSVWQWCDDWYSSTYFSSAPLVNPKGPLIGKEKICKGGCFLCGFKEDTDIQLFRFYRGKDEVNVVANDATFRIVRDF